MLEVRNLVTGYGDFQVLFGVDIDVAQGEAVALIGANGAGKTTLLGAIAGVNKKVSGTVTFKGKNTGDLSAADMVRRGVAMVPEGRGIFASLSVEENLRVGAYTRRRGPWTLQSVYALFPMLKERRNAAAIDLSGGQQQMVAIGRALMSNPDLLLCDEISLGLAPNVVKDIYAALPKILVEGIGVILVEQNIDVAVQATSRAFCLMHGRITLSGDGKKLDREKISRAYFGLEEARDEHVA